jgi:hypothetical protein
MKFPLIRALPHHHKQKISTCDSACFHGFCRSDRPKPPDRRSPALRRIASDGKPNTPVKVVFFVCPLPSSCKHRVCCHFLASAPSLSFLPLLACTLQPLPADTRHRISIPISSPLQYPRRTVTVFHEWHASHFVLSLCVSFLYNVFLWYSILEPHSTSGYLFGRGHSPTPRSLPFFHQSTNAFPSCVFTASLLL